MCLREPSLVGSRPPAKNYESSVWSVIGCDSWPSRRELSLKISVCCSLVSGSFGMGSLFSSSHMYFTTSFADSDLLLRTRLGVA